MFCTLHYINACAKACIAVPLVEVMRAPKINKEDTKEHRIEENTRILGELSDDEPEIKSTSATVIGKLKGVTARKGISGLNMTGDIAMAWMRQHPRFLSKLSMLSWVCGNDAVLKPLSFCWVQGWYLTATSSAFQLWYPTQKQNQDLCKLQMTGKIVQHHELRHVPNLHKDKQYVNRGRTTFPAFAISVYEKQGWGMAVCCNQGMERKNQDWPSKWMATNRHTIDATNEDNNFMHTLARLIQTHELGMMHFNDVSFEPSVQSHDIARIRKIDIFQLADDRYSLDGHKMDGAMYAYTGKLMECIRSNLESLRKADGSLTMYTKRVGFLAKIPPFKQVVAAANSVREASANSNRKRGRSSNSDGGDDDQHVAKRRKVATGEQMSY